MVSTKGTGREPAAATWPSPSDLNNISSRNPPHRPKLSQSIFTQPETKRHNSQTSRNTPLAEGSHRDENHSSNTWTSSSENPDLASEDGNDSRDHFILEYNRLAQQHGIRPIVPGDFSPPAGHTNDLLDGRRGSWLSKMLRQSSEQLDQTTIKPIKPSLRHQRRTSDVALDFVHGKKRDGLKNQDLKALVRFYGKSPLFLPTDYAPFSLTLPTCFRALAQALVQHAETKGIFRISGSARVINALYDYYCTDDNTEAISNTTRCPTLPSHIRCNAHDIASTFKRFLAGLPGGILGSLSLFDALVAIHSQLQGDPEWHRTKESKLRARLIALAIGTVKSQYQRELICAVFGLLCLVGRVAENAPREDENGRPLPTSDLMGYNALGIIFGPLLIGDLIDNYSMKVANPSAGLILLPVSSPRSRKEGRKHRRRRKTQRKHAKTNTPSATSLFAVDKIHIANSITEMLIVHWREVVRQIRNTGSVRTRRSASNPQHPEGVTTNIPLSVSENFSSQHSTHWDHARRRSVSPSIASLRGTSRTNSTSTIDKQEASISGSGPTQKQLANSLPHLLSPTIEESPSSRAEASKFSHGHQYSASPGMSRMNLNVVADGAGQSHTEIDKLTVPRGNSSDRSLPRSITDPRLSQNGRSTPTRLLDLGYIASGVRNDTDHGGGILTRSPADQWRSLVASSKASTESLVKSAKERRLKRSVGNISSRSSRESSSLANPRPTTPEWKQRAAQRGELKGSEGSILPETPHLIHPTLKARVEQFSPEKHPSDTPYRESSRRSASKPVPGAVKAMAALFEDAAEARFDSPASAQIARTRPSLRESSSFSYRDAIDGSPTKSNAPRDAVSPTKSAIRLDDDSYQRRPAGTPTLDRYSSTPEGQSTVRASPSRLTIEDTPTRSLRDTLRPVGTFTSSRKEAPDKPAHEIDPRTQPPRLGAMIPYQEEPPIGHFMRPSSSTSAQSRNISIDPPLDSRHTSSGTSFLHTQIRNLQRQLETKNEEILHLRRQLETQDHMDIGTLCEQLRVAKRECLMWRKRAEAAERRVAVFQRFGSRFQALTDGVDDDWAVRSIDGGSRRGFAGKMRSDGAVFEDGGEGCELWDAARELMDFRHGGGMHV